MAGKTKFLRHYHAQNPARREAGCLVQPVIYAEFPGKITLIGAAKLLLETLEDPNNGKGNLSDLTYRVRHQLQAQKVEVLLLDEFQHIVETGDITLNKVADWFKQITKSTNVPLVMAGMPSSDRIIRGHPQFAGITPYRYTLGQFGFDSRQDRNAFREFLARLDAALPFDGIAGLADREWATFLFDASGGRLRPLIRLVKQAALHALDRGSASVGQIDLAYGFEQIEPADATMENPFGPPPIVQCA